MSAAIIHKGIVYTCGCVCEEGGESKDAKQQTKDALAELDRVLGLAKSDKHHILSMQASRILQTHSSASSPGSNRSALFFFHACL